MEGWIKLHRKLLSWEWYKESNMVHLFTHLLMIANREDKNYRGVYIKRGQILTGRKKLSDDTGISERSIRTCLEKLKMTNEICIKPTNKYSVITINNYEFYNPFFNNSDQQPTSKRPTKRPDNDQQNDQQGIDEKANGNQDFKEVEVDERPANAPTKRQQKYTKPTTNKNKEYKKIINIMSELESSDQLYEQIAYSFWMLFKSNMEKLGINSTDLSKARPEKWVSHVRLMMENDKRTLDEIREVYKLLQVDGFWQQNIRSTDKLRKQFERLLMKARKSGNLFTANIMAKDLLTNMQ